MAKVKKIERIIPVSGAELPLGEYPGFWGGYVAHAEIMGETFRFETEDGIRTMAAPCFVSVGETGNVTVRVMTSAEKARR